MISQNTGKLHFTQVQGVIINDVLAPKLDCCHQLKKGREGYLKNVLIYFTDTLWLPQ